MMSDEGGRAAVVEGDGGEIFDHRLRGKYLAPMAANTVKPSLKVVGVHIEGFRALRKVDWPEDGIGWNGTVPDMVVVGGVNGSGKTTLLELIAEAAQELFLRGYRASMAIPNNSPVTFEFIHPRWRQEFQASFNRGLETSFPDEFYHVLGNADSFAKSDIPSVIYMPTDRRLVIPAETYKGAGKLAAHETFFYRFSHAERWRDSLEAILYDARWADLNAKEEGHPERATHFRSYAEAFKGFFGDTKELTWSHGELFVKINETGALHPLMDLSSGEKQALILAAELYRRWRPGSLVLIDEPELHFHSAWQTTLYTMLERWQKERGGQVILATQSNHLFSIAAPDTTVLLKGPLA